MKLKLALFVFLGLAPIMSRAQSSLTIFSEDGYKFFLVLNGQKQNSIPQTNVRIEGLTQPYYSAKILFEDASKPEISKNIPVNDPSTNANADVTYKIKTAKDGDLKMRYFSATPVQPNYAAPPDVYVMHFGQQAPPPANTVTQTTVTTTSAPVNSGTNISVGGGGVSMSINVNDPNMGGSATQTTTTTTYSNTTTQGGYNTNNYNDPPPPPPARNGCNYPMNPGSFKSAKETISKASFEDTKLSTAKSVLSSNCVSTEQVIQICNLFSFEESKLDFAKFAYGKTTDKGNYFKVGNVFSFDASKTDLNSFISNQ
jgi:hypothetical protein